MSQETLRFRDWFLEQLRLRDWGRLEFAQRTGVSRGIVGKWLRWPGDPDYRRPSYESCVKIARTFGVSLDTVLELVGLEDKREHPGATQLQQHAAAVTYLLPDLVLATVYPQLRALLDGRIQQEIAETLAVLAQQDGFPKSPAPRTAAESGAERPRRLSPESEGAE